MSVTTRNSRNGNAGSAGREVLKLTSRIIRRTVAEHVPHPPAPVALLERIQDSEGAPLAQRLRTVPIQCSIDIAVPLALAYEEWMKFEFLPEGAHRVCEIERDGDILRGVVNGLRGEIAWAAEIRDERPEESFA